MLETKWNLHLYKEGNANQADYLSAFWKSTLTFALYFLVS